MNYLTSKFQVGKNKRNHWRLNLLSNYKLNMQIHQGQADNRLYIQSKVFESKFYNLRQNMGYRSKYHLSKNLRHILCNNHYMHQNKLCNWQLNTKWHKKNSRWKECIHHRIWSKPFDFHTVQFVNTYLQKS